MRSLRIITCAIEIVRIKFDSYFVKFMTCSNQVRFFLVGSLSAFLGACDILLIQYIVGTYISVQWVFLIGNIAVSPIAFCGMKYLVFESVGPFFPEYLKYIYSTSANLLFGVIFLSALVTVMKIEENIAHIVNIGGCVIMIYLIHKYYTFQKR